MSSAPLRVVLAYISGPLRVQWLCRSEAVERRLVRHHAARPVLLPLPCVSVLDRGEPLSSSRSGRLAGRPQTPSMLGCTRIWAFDAVRVLDFAGSAASGPPYEMVLSRATTRLHCTHRISGRASASRRFTKPAPLWELGRPREQPVYMGRHLSCFWCALADSLPKPNEPVPVSRPNLLGYRRKSVAK